jgi:hypothetical protein
VHQFATRPRTAPHRTEKIQIEYRTQKRKKKIKKRKSLKAFARVSLKTQKQVKKAPE